jgi:hypothetical protein
MWLSLAVLLTIGVVMTFVNLLYSPEPKHLQFEEIGEKERASLKVQEPKTLAA